jgi:endonuclease/exonuclease/phosphatase family metal-dependent hydrolase
MQFTLASYNAYRERNGRDSALDRLLEESGTFACLQEVSRSRARWLRRELGRRAYVTRVKHGMQYLALVIPEGAEFSDRQAVQLNGLFGVVPGWRSLRRGIRLCRGAARGWRDALEPRAAQVVRVRWRGITFQLGNTHLPYEPGLRSRCYTPVVRALELPDAIVAGDFNATPDDLFYADFLRATGLRMVEDTGPTHGRRRIDYVLYRGRLVALGCETEESLSDHRMIRTRLEVEP